MAQKTPTIVITGAHGFVGSYLVDYFAAKGWNVTGLVRNPAKQSARPHVRYVAYDIATRPDETAFEGADYLIHLAYMKSDYKNPDALQQNIAGARRLMAISRTYKLRKNIFMSSMSAQPDALSSYGRQKFRIEKLFKTNRDAVVRSGLVIGDGGLLKQTVAFMSSKHVAPLIGGGSQPLQVIAIYDLARAIDTLLVGRRSGTFTIASPQPYTYRSLYKTVAKVLGLRVLFVPVPFAVPQLVLRSIKLLHLPFPVNEDNLLGLKRLRYFDTTKDLQRLGLTVDDLKAALQKLDLTVSRS